MDIGEDSSFVHVPNENEPALSLKIQPLYEMIGVDADLKSTEFCATITAQAIPDDDSKRAPVDIVVALDISASMRGSKLELCKTTLSLLLRELRSSDRFGLVVFGSEAKVIIPPQQLTKEIRDAALVQIKGLCTAGSTNMSGGIGLAAQEIRSIQSPHEVQAVFLLTDGQANVGIKDKDGMVHLTKNCFGESSSQKPLPIHCFGYGSDHNREMLRDVSMVTPGGTYYFISNDDDVSSAFGDALGGVLSVVAQNVTLVLEVPKETPWAKIVTVKHDDAIKNVNGTYSISLKDFYAEESRDVVFEVTLSEIHNTGPVPHIVGRMNYLHTLKSMVVTSEDIFGTIRRPEGDEISQVNKHVFLQCIRIQTTDVIEESQKLADRGEIEEAKKKISTHINLLQTYNSAEENAFLSQLLNELNVIKSGLTSQATYKSVGSFAMQSNWMSHKMQRCAESNEQANNLYRSSKKVMYAKRMKSMSRKL